MLCSPNNFETLENEQQTIRNRSDKCKGLQLFFGRSSVKPCQELQLHSFIACIGNYGNRGLIDDYIHVSNCSFIFGPANLINVPIAKRTLNVRIHAHARALAYM